MMGKPSSATLFSLRTSWCLRIFLWRCAVTNDPASFRELLGRGTVRASYASPAHQEVRRQRSPLERRILEIPHDTDPVSPDRGRNLTGSYSHHVSPFWDVSCHTPGNASTRRMKRKSLRDQRSTKRVGTGVRHGQAGRENVGTDSVGGKGRSDTIRSLSR